MGRHITDAQRQAINLMIEHPDWQQNKIAEIVGVHYNTVCIWLHDDFFLAELNKELHANFQQGSRLAVDTIIKLAAAGDRQAAQYILDNTGFKLADKLDISSNDIKISISE